MTQAPTALDPKLLGLWVRCIREAQYVSQEALAASSGVNIRTIQRMEAGNVVNVTTRRCLARALGYENRDAFDDPQFALEVYKFLETINDKAFEQQHPDCIRLKAEPVQSGEDLRRLAGASNALSLSTDDTLSLDAKTAAAAMFDYVHDLLDIKYDASFSNKLNFSQELETMLRELEGLGAAVYSALRSTKITRDNWVNKTPLPLTIGYLVVVPKGQDRFLKEIIASRRLSAM